MLRNLRIIHVILLYIVLTQPSLAGLVPLEGVKQLWKGGDAFGDHSCVVMNDGKIKCWGANYNGQVGNGTYTFTNGVPSGVLLPVDVVGLESPVSSVSLGAYHSCTIVDGNVKCWGLLAAEIFPSLDPNYQHSHMEAIPTNINGLNGASEIASGLGYVCALIGDRVKCIGWNEFGVLGNGTRVSSNIPVDVGLSGVTAITGGNYHVCALLTGGHVKCWGTIRSHSDAEPLLTPTDILNEDGTLLSGVSSFDAGGNSTCAIVGANSQVKCWGYGFADHALNISNWNMTTNQLELLIGASQIVIGGEGTSYACVLVSERMICWNRLVSELNGGLTGIKQIAAGALHLCALMDDSRVKCWGRNPHGQLGNNSIDVTNTDLPPVYVLTEGAYFSIVVNGTGGGSITGSTPDGDYPLNTSINLVALPDDNSDFAGWSPASCVNGFSLVADTTCTATFNAKPQIENDFGVYCTYGDATSSVPNATTSSSFSWKLEANTLSAPYEELNAGGIPLPGNQEALAAHFATRLQNVLASSITYPFLGNSCFYIDEIIEPSLFVGVANQSPAGYCKVEPKPPGEPVCRYNPAIVKLPLDNTCRKLIPNMRAWYSLEENANDKRHNHHGSLVKNPLSVPGKVGKALQFDGLSYSEIADNSNLNMGTGHFSFYTWIKTSHKTGTGTLLSKRDDQLSTGKRQGYALYLYNGQLWMQLADGTGTGACSINASSSCTDYSSNTFIADDNWHFIGVTVDRNDTNGGKFYVDGVQVGTFNPTYRKGSLDNTKPLRLASSSLGTGLFKGILDEVAIFNRVLTNEEILAVYQSDSVGICKVDTPTICDYRLSATSTSHSSETGTGNIAVVASNIASNSACAWTASSNQTWINITSGSSGTGNGTVSYSAQANPTTAPRTGTLTIAGQTFTIHQAGQPEQAAQAVYSLNVTNHGMGTVTSSPSGIVCGTDCTENYTASTRATLTAKPDNGWAFSSWGGDCGGNSLTTSVTMQTVKTCTANFTLISPVSYTLTVATSGNGSGTVGGGGTYTKDTLVTPTASPSPDSTFIGWTPASCGSTFTLTADTACIANFTTNGDPLPPDYIQLTVQKLGQGNVSGGGVYAGGSTISLTASPADGWSFKAWEPAPCAASFTMPAQNLTCTATFEAIPRLEMNPAAYDFGTVPVLPATAEGQTLPKRGTRNADYAPNRVIVKFRDSSTRDTRRASRSRQRAGLIHELPLINAEVWQVADVEAVINAQTRSADREIEYIEPDYLVTLNAMPNDPGMNWLWGLHNTGQGGGTIDADIDAPEAWDMTTGDSMVCGVIDSGVDYTHPDLAANLWQNPGEIPGNGLDDDSNGYVDDVYGYDFINNDSDPMDDNGHGTHVAGTMAGIGNNGIGVAGVNWTGKVMALKFLSAEGRGSISNAVRAIEYATQMGVKCTNNSWGGGGYSQALYDAIQAAGNNGALFVAAAGNASGNSDISPVYPAGLNLDNILSVCASDRRDELAAFSNYGASTVDLCAPGVGIPSSVPGNRYALYSGTSMASPHVAGAVALLWAAHPELSAAQVKARLMASVDVKSNLAGSSVTGGRLNLYRMFSGIDQTSYDFIVTNTSQAVITLAQATLTGANPAEFKIQQDTCSGSLTPGASCKVSVNFSPTSAGAKQATLSVSTTGSQSASASLSGNATVVSGAGSSVTAFSFAEPSVYNPQTGQASLPSVFIAGNAAQEYSITLCQAGGAFTVCGIHPQSALSGESEQLGNVVFNPATGIAEIPVIRIQGVSGGGEAGITPCAYSVQLQLVNGLLQVIGLTPIW